MWPRDAQSAIPVQTGNLRAVQLLEPCSHRSDANLAAEWKRGFFRRSLASRDAEQANDTNVPGRRTTKLARLEAVLLVADGALSTRRLAQLATLADVREAGQLIDRLNAEYDRVQTAFRIERVAAGFQLLTRPEFSYWLGKLHQRQAELKLSPPALETLTIVAYRQPVIRADVEAIRGVQCAEMLKQLMERGLVRIGGQQDSLGRPHLYETTRRFLELFGLRRLDDLPMADRLRQAKPKKPADDTPPVETPATEGESSESTSTETDASETDTELGSAA